MKDELELFLMVERGELTAEEAATILEKRQETYSGANEEVPDSAPADMSEQPVLDTHAEENWHFERFTHWWLVPFLIGLLVTTLGAFWMYLGWNTGDPLLGFWLAWIPFAMGIFFMALSWRARASHWIHLRIHQSEGRNLKNITVRFPLPFGLVKWVNRRFGHLFPPEVRGIDVDELIDSIEESVTVDNPIYVWADDESERQQVEIWIGRGAE